jgi:hypothetical protein
MAKPSFWLLLEGLLERGDPAFVTELRQVHDAEQLGGFANRWFADSRPWARQFLFEPFTGEMRTMILPEGSKDKRQRYEVPLSPLRSIRPNMPNRDCGQLAVCSIS